MDYSAVFQSAFGSYKLLYLLYSLYVYNRGKI